MAQVPPRPRHLPLAPEAGPAHRRLPLAGPARAVDQRWRPIYAVWEVTLRCDLACRHCGSRAGRARPEELTTAECLDLVRQMAELGVKEVTLIGGEAYLRDDWTEIVRAVRAHGMQCSMTTGGRGLSAERARQAREAGIDSVSVSLDGLREVHDQLRGVQGSFDAAMAALWHLRQAGVAVSANTQFCRYNLQDMPELLERLIERGIHSWQLQLTTAMGRAADEPAMLLQPHEMLELMPLLARLKVRADAAGVRVWPGNNIGYFGPYESLLRGHLPRGHRAACGAGRSTLGIEANGDIKGCPSLPTADYVGGNVRDHSLRAIWEQTTPLRFTRDQTVDDLWGYCRTCYYAEDCRAGCSWTAHVLFGKPGNNPYCHHRALELAREGKRERIVLEQPAPGEPFDFARFALVLEDWPEEDWPRAQQLLECPEPAR